MKNVRIYGLLLALFGLLFTAHSQATEEGQSLFVNLTSDDIDRAAMAIGFSTKIRQKKQIPVTLFLNVEGVRIADKNIPEHQHANGKSLKEMLTDFMSAGGKVIVCPMCMQNVGGLSKQDLIDGIEMGGPDVTWPALFAEGTRVLSY